MQSPQWKKEKIGGLRGEADQVKFINVQLMNGLKEIFFYSYERKHLSKQNF